MDDILIGATDEDDMCKKLCEIFETLAKYNLRIQLDKVELYKTEVKILGMI